jgi:cell division protein FtsI/penicillin-binding protein 2
MSEIDIRIETKLNKKEAGQTMSTSEILEWSERVVNNPNDDLQPVLSQIATDVESQPVINEIMTEGDLQPGFNDCLAEGELMIVIAERTTQGDLQPVENSQFYIDTIGREWPMSSIFKFVAAAYYKTFMTNRKEWIDGENISEQKLVEWEKEKVHGIISEIWNIGGPENRPKWYYSILCQMRLMTNGYEKWRVQQEYCRIFCLILQKLKKFQ